MYSVVYTGWLSVFYSLSDRFANQLIKQNNVVQSEPPLLQRRAHARNVSFFKTCYGG